MKNSFYVFWLFLAVSIPLSAQEYNEVSYFDFNTTMRDAHKSALSLKVQEAKLAIQKERARNPFNLIPIYLDDYTDFMVMFFNENTQEYQRKVEQKEVIIAKIARGDQGSPYYNYILADTYLRWTILHIKFGDLSEAAKSLKKASSYIDKNNKTFPNFTANKKIEGLYEIIAGNISNEIKSIKGSSVAGHKLMNELLNFGKKYPNFEFNEEVNILYALTLVYLGTDDPNAWSNINTSYLDYTANPVATYIMASMSLRTGRSQKALAMIGKAPSGYAYQAIYQLEYLRGLCKIYNLDETAEAHFNNFLQYYKGVHGIKDAHQKIAWIRLIKGKTNEYKGIIARVKNSGADWLDADIEAQIEFESNEVPDLAILKARLRFEGGFYEKALGELALCNEKGLTDREKVEFIYLKGRIFQKMKKYDDAIYQYNKTIEIASNKPYFFACSAALFSGIIWEERLNSAKAKEAYNLCLKLKPTIYQKVLHNRAKSRLDDLG